MAVLALGLALLAMVFIAPAGAPARGTIARRGACPPAEKHARHAVRGSHCVKRASRHARPVSHQPQKHSHPVKKRTHRTSPVAVQAPALCEDESAPVRSGGEFSCQDGSEPSCEDASEPTALSPGGVPLCPAVEEQAPPAAGEPCETEGTAECRPVEWSCEGSVGEAAVPCERSGGGEAAS
jgi:hypothetical protein